MFGGSKSSRTAAMDMKEHLQGVVQFGRVLALLLAVFSSVTYVVTLVLGPTLFFTTADGMKEAVRHVQRLPVEIFMLVPISFPVGISHGALFLAISTIFVLCLAMAAFSCGGFVKAVRESLSKPISIAKTNFLYLMPLVGAGLLSATILISEFQTTQGVQTGSLNFPPQTNPYYILLNLAYAPIDEEFAFRITTIGIPVAIMLLYSYRSDPRLAGIKKKIGLFFLTMFSPELAKSKLGHKTVAANGVLGGMSPAEWALILLTSVMFGFAHILYGGGWAIGKVSTACLAGFVFAVMYVSYGAYADILLHWFFNYYFTVLDMGSTAYGAAFTGFANLTYLVNLAAGGIVLFFVLILSAFKLSDYLSLRATGATPT
jgi:hypothetical protein